MTVSRWLPTPVLVLGALAILVTAPVAVRAESAKELPWFVGSAAFLVAAAIVWWRRPDHPVAGWFAVSGGIVGIVQALDGLLLHHLRAGGSEVALAASVSAFHLGMAAGCIAIAHLLGLFPDGAVERTYERRVLRATWFLLLLPPAVLVARPTLLFPVYHQIDGVPNPFHLPALAPVAGVASAGVQLFQVVFAVGAVLLVGRYRRGGRARRRRIRWLLLPALFASFVAVADLLAWANLGPSRPSFAAEVALSVLWIVAIASLPTAIAIALLRPEVVDVDRVLRKSLVYGALWSLIALVYVGSAAGLGVAAGQRLPVGTAIVLTVVATLLFHPARQRLEALADRWVFGARTDPARLVTRLGQTLAGTFDLEMLVPRMTATLEEGLGLEWARIRLVGDAATDGHDVQLAVPITLGDEELGVVECGPKRSGAFTPEDEEAIRTFARQAALAVRNLRLTTALATQAEEISASRARLVRAQETERRRIERNIHDGAQQDLVALIGQLAHVRRVVVRDPDAATAELEVLQAGLRQVIADLRELAHGIHPSLLSDRGLLEAVEALAARSSVPVEVRADPALRAERFAEAVEGAGYFTVAEALANVGKHASARQASVRLARSNGTITIEVSDDGVGFDPASVRGEGLRNLAERLAALDGELRVTSRPGGGTTLTARLAAEAAGAEPVRA